ncbi:MAG: hypothetical protein ABR523_00500 [Desulfurivibrionaceae bacterium]
MKGMVFFSLLAALFFVGAVYGWAGDLDDGISTFTDDGISSYDDMGKPDKNIKFIIMNSKSRAKVAQKAGKASTTTGQTTGDNNRNSVVMGAGSKVLGDVIIVDESKNN